MDHPLCACGCGSPVVWRNRKGTNTLIRGHHTRLKRGKTYLYRLGKPVHRIRAEKALGRPLPKGVVVHHADGSRSEHSALVICPDQKYHFLLHIRMRVRDAGGNPNTDRICCSCQAVKPIAAMTRNKGRFNLCLVCNRRMVRETKARRRAREATL